MKRIRDLIIIEKLLLIILLLYRCATTFILPHLAHIREVYSSVPMYD
jgi:hypothetical protein